MYCSAILDLQTETSGRQVPVVIERGMLRVQFDREPRRIILYRGRRGGSSRLCAERKGAVIDVRTWMHLAMPPRAFDPRPSKKRSRPRVCRPRRRRCRQDLPLLCDPGNRRNSRDHIQLDPPEKRGWCGVWSRPTASTFPI